MSSKSGSSNLENEAQDWIEAITGERFTGGSFAESLKDGILLCRLINRIKPGSVAKVNDPATMPFKKMENISNFLKAIRALGMKEFETFGTGDLYDEKNVPQVVKAIHALGRTVQTTMPDSGLPTLGIKVVEKHERHFSEEQLRQATSAVSVLNLGSSDMAKKAFMNALEGGHGPHSSSPGSSGSGGSSYPGSPGLRKASESPARPGVAAAAAPIPSPSRPFLKGAAVPAPAPAPAPAAASIPGPVMPPKPPKPAAAPALPPGWEELKTDEGESYYYCAATDETTWDRPAPPPPQPAARAPPPPARPPPPPAAPALPPGWEELKTEAGESYYCNNRTGATTWDRPAF